MFAIVMEHMSGSSLDTGLLIASGTWNTVLLAHHLCSAEKLLLYEYFYQIAATVLSMEEVGRQDFAWKEYRNVDFVLIDESHNFRNPATIRYRNLFRLLAAGKRGKRVALLTATPINNTIWDVYHQIMLLTRGQEDYYRDIGIGNLRSFFARVDKGNSELFDLLEATTVRRSRRDVQRRQQAGERVLINGAEVRFPERMLGTITYDLDGTYAGFYASIANNIERLTLVSYNIEQFKRSNQQQTTIDRNSAIIGMWWQYCYTPGCAALPPSQRQTQAGGEADVACNHQEVRL